MTWQLRTRALPLDRPLLMGIVNVTPDSFSDGGQFASAGEAVAHGRRLADEGADLLDVGGESTRPGAAEVSIDEELSRIMPVVEILAGDGFVVSIDTSKPEVAAGAIDAGAEVINDVTGFRDPVMRSLAIKHQTGAVVMHMAGSPRTMQHDPQYDDVVAEVGTYLTTQAQLLIDEGLSARRICIDPGIGFGKTTKHNLALLGGTRLLSRLGYPLMVGASRKRFLGELLGVDATEDRDVATAILSGLLGERGANVIRVHNVGLSRRATLLSSAIVAHT